MSRYVRTFIMLVGAIVLSAASWAQSSPDAIVVVVLNGPHAGTYKTPLSETICAHYKALKWTFATWRDTETPDGKKMTTAAIKVSNPEQAGPKRGEVRVSFGAAPGKTSQANWVINDAPVTLTIKGKGAEMSFDGKTSEGIGLRVNAKCDEMENLP